MGTTCRTLLLLAITAFTTFGCAGTMKGIIRQGGIDLPFSYSQPFSGPDTLQTALPDGERFSGEVVEYGSAAMRTAQAGSTATGTPSISGASGADWCVRPSDTRGTHGGNGTGPSNTPGNGTGSWSFWPAAVFCPSPRKETTTALSW